MREPDSFILEKRPPFTLLMVAGEASGDAHGAELIQHLRQRQPEGLRIIGVGGPRMLAAGQEQLFDLTAHAVIGLTEVVKHFFKFRSFLQRIVALARQERPDVIVLIDSSGFNLRLAPRLRSDLPKARIIYYISPQVWASRPQRVEVISRSIDLVLSILPFEKDWYAARAPELKVQWVGHPVLDRIQKVEKAVPNPDWVALLPGSRRTEIAAHLPDLWASARLMGRQRKEIKFILLSPNEEMQKFSLELLALQPPANFGFEYNIGYAVSHLSRCSLALVASGTASLECALVGIPQIVVYRVHPLTYLVGRRVVTVSHLSLINVMAGEEVVPEFLQDRFRPEAVAQTALELLDNVARRDMMRRRVTELVATLGGPGASRRAAEAILLEAALAKAK
jgi:lipid-A-disaccharide synthase